MPIEKIEPTHIQITPLENDQWGWVVWYGIGGGEDPEHPLDREGISPTLCDAWTAIRDIIDDAKA